MARAPKFTISVMTKSTRPEAISAPRPILPASPYWLAMFAAMVLPPGVKIFQTISKLLDSTSATAIVSPSARPKPSTVALATPERAERQHRHADHLPAGGAERQRRLALGLRHLQEDLAGDRGDDRQDHDRQHQRRGEDRLTEAALRC